MTHLQPFLAPITAALAALALATALLAQYGFGLAPCPLCIWQRWPYAAALILGLLAWRLRPPRLLLALAAAAAFLASAGVGGFHAGIEAGLWPGPASCTTVATPDSIAALRAQLAATTPARCDEAPFYLLGLSIAGWNAVYGVMAASAVLLLAGAGRKTAG